MSLERAANYIKTELDGTGLPTSIQGWKANDITYQNIIASHHPKANKRFIVGAHYDVYYDQPGADDNASGVAGLIELARLLAQAAVPADYGVDFVSFCLEEPPFFKKKEMGSYVHAQSIYDKGQDIMGMISLEMIGYYMEKSGFPADANRDAEGGAAMNRFLVVSGIEKFESFNIGISQRMREAKEIGVNRVTFSDTDPNNGPSDHRNYWTFGYPAAMIIAGKKRGNPNYHKITDTIGTLDFNTMAAAVNSIFHLISTLDRPLNVR